MRKCKVYFGKNKHVNRYGKTTDLSKSQWAVPQLLRRYFTLQFSRWLDMQQLKLRMNSVVGARAIPSVDSEFFGQLLEERRQLKQKFMSGNF